MWRNEGFQFLPTALLDEWRISVHAYGPAESRRLASSLQRSLYAVVNLTPTELLYRIGLLLIGASPGPIAPVGMVQSAQKAPQAKPSPARHYLRLEGVLDAASGLAAQTKVLKQRSDHLHHAGEAKALGEAFNRKDRVRRGASSKA